jgi:hypothetical protein
MAFTASKRWELVGITSYGYNCTNIKHAGVYTRITPYLTFIDTVINDNSSKIPIATCSCQCPRGSHQGLAYTKGNSLEACIHACKTVPLTSCISSNTYACLGLNCAYSRGYSLCNNSTYYGVHISADGDRYEMGCS